MRAIRHPLSGAIYDLEEDGTVRVTHGDSTGRFTSHGVWIDGELRTADAHLCLWIAGPSLDGRRPGCTTAEASDPA
jgi:hypothetical protein